MSAFSLVRPIDDATCWMIIFKNLLKARCLLLWLQPAPWKHQKIWYVVCTSHSISHPLRLTAIEEFNFWNKLYLSAFVHRMLRSTFQINQKLCAKRTVWASLIIVDWSWLQIKSYIDIRKSIECKACWSQAWLKKWTIDNRLNVYMMYWQEYPPTSWMTRAVVHDLNYINKQSESSPCKQR